MPGIWRPSKPKVRVEVATLSPYQQLRGTHKSFKLTKLQYPDRTAINSFSSFRQNPSQRVPISPRFEQGNKTQPHISSELVRFAETSSRYILEYVSQLVYSIFSIVSQLFLTRPAAIHAGSAQCGHSEMIGSGVT